MTIKHIIISGGAYNGIDLIGIVCELYEKKYFLRTSIQSVYGSSAGAIVLAIWLLDIEKEVLFDFIIRKPWNKIYSFNAEMLIDMFNNKGVLDNKLIFEIMSPLLKSKNLNPDITLFEFYNYTKIKFKVYTTHFNDWKGICLDHEKYPDMKLIQALYMSSAMPVIFKPAVFDNRLYIDGAITKHFPVKSALEDGCSKDEILGIRVYRPDEHSIDQDSSFFQYIGGMMNNVVGAFASLEQEDIPNYIFHSVPRMGSEIEEALFKPEKRQEMINRGIRSATIFLQSRV